MKILTSQLSVTKRWQKRLWRDVVAPEAEDGPVLAPCDPQARNWFSTVAILFNLDF